MEQVDFSLRSHCWVSPLAPGIDIALVVMSIWGIGVLIDRILLLRRWRTQSARGDAAREVIVARVRFGMRTVATIAVTAPLLGVWGTIVGLSRVFEGVAATGSGGLGAISGGVAEALPMTSYGLLVAIGGAWAHSYLGGRMDGVRGARV